jgi:hypothetical protein
MQATKYISIAILGICGMLSNASYATDRTTDDVFSAYSASNISSTHIYSTYHTSTYHTSTYHTSTPLSPIASTTAPQLTSTMFDTQDQSDIRGRMNANSNDPFGGGTLPNLPYQPGAVPTGDIPMGFLLLLLTIYILSITRKQHTISSK